ncbi:MAG: periplasmic heavy metal sensor [Pseudomonadota bacterium]
MTDASDDVAQTQPRWRMPRWGWVLVFISLALNLLVVGSIIGMRFAGPGGGWHAGGGHEGRGGMRRVLRSLPQDQRKEVRALLREHRQKVRPLRRALREETRKLRPLLEAESLDQAAFTAQLDVIEKRRAGIQRELRSMVEDLAVKLPPDVRARVIARIIGRGTGRKRRR